MIVKSGKRTEQDGRKKRAELKRLCDKCDSVHGHLGVLS